MRLLSHRASSSFAALLVAWSLQGCAGEDTKTDAAAGSSGAAAGSSGQGGGSGQGGSSAGQGGSDAGSAGASAGAGAAGESGASGQAGAAGQGGAGQAGAGGESGSSGQAGAGGESGQSGASGQAGEAGAAGASAASGSSGQAGSGAAGAGGSGAGGSGAGAGGEAGSGGSGGSQAQTALVVTGPAATQVSDGGELAPFNLDGITPYSDGIVDVTLTNGGTAPMVIESVTIAPVEATTPPTLADEWRLSKAGSTGYSPITVENLTLEPTQGTSLAGFFSPVVSGPRQALVTITYDGGKVFTLTLVGRGRDNAVFSPHASSLQEVIYGDPAADLLTGGLVSDADGNAWATANATQWKDNFTQNIVVYNVKPDGSLGWARLWNEPFDQRQPDPGQNAESGGGTDCIAADATHLYVVGRRSLDNSNSLFQTLVFKVDKATGAIAWARGISMNAGPSPKVAADSSEAYAVDARHGDRILVTGNGGNAQAGTGFVTLFALDKSTGELIFDQLIKANPGVQERGHAIVSDGAGHAYIGGFTGGTGMLVRVTDVNSATPKVDWVRKVGIGVGGNLNSLDIDPEGDVYASLDRRGATTFLSFARVSKAGQLVWAKTWDDQNTGDNNNSYVVRLNEGKVYFGGRVAIKPFDTQYADGFLMSASAADGAYSWASFYYNGKGAEEMTEHRLKGIGFNADGSVRTLLQSYTNGLNFDHYWGHWYQATDYTLELPAGDGAKRYADYSFELTDLTPQATIVDAPKAVAHVIDTATIWVDPQETATLAPLKTRAGNGGDGSSVIQHVQLTP